MAYLYARGGRRGRKKRGNAGRIEIREAHSTPRGPRSRTLVSFQGALLPEHLERAESRARRPFDREAIRRRARELGIAVPEERADDAARDLLTRLRRGAAIDPRLVTLLREQLAPLPDSPVSDELADAAEWIGTGELERGRALRDVLRLYDAIARSRDPVREAPPERFPHFASRRGRAAS